MASIQLSCWPKFPHVLSWKRTSIPPSSVIPKFLPLSQISLVLRHSSSYGHGYGGGIRGMAASSGAQMEESIKKKISENALVIYSKTSCPYCCEVKALFDRLGVKPSVVELDDLGPTQRQLQNALQRLTGQSTVPNIFIEADQMKLHFHYRSCERALSMDLPRRWPSGEKGDSLDRYRVASILEVVAIQWPCTRKGNLFPCFQQLESEFLSVEILADIKFT